MARHYDFECVRCESVLKCNGKQKEDVACINFVERENITKLEEYRTRVYGKTKDDK